MNLKKIYEISLNKWEKVLESIKNKQPLYQEDCIFCKDLEDSGTDDCVDCKANQDLCHLVDTFDYTNDKEICQKVIDGIKKEIVKLK